MNESHEIILLSMYAHYEWEVIQVIYDVKKFLPTLQQIYFVIVFFLLTSSSFSMRKGGWKKTTANDANFDAFVTFTSYHHQHCKKIRSRRDEKYFLFKKQICTFRKLGM